MRTKGNIILIGMPGAGKSTIGVVLAKACGMEFLDSDLLIQKQTGKRLWQIIEEEGLEKFIEIEEQTNCMIDVENTIIATGGSAVYSDNAMRHFQKMGKVIYLSVSCEELKERLGDIKNRGVVIRDGQTLEELYQERKERYERYADFTIYVGRNSLRDTVEEIMQEITKNQKDKGE